MKTIKAFTDSITVCDCCGKTNLKGTYLVTDEFGGEFYYGSNCAIKNLGVTSSEFKAKSTVSSIIKNIISEASCLGDMSQLENNIQILIEKYKLRLPVSNPYFNKSIQSSF